MMNIQIKEGLSFTIAESNTLKVSGAFLEQRNNQLDLYFYYTSAVEVFKQPEKAITFELHFYFSYQYLNAFYNTNPEDKSIHTMLPAQLEQAICFESQVVLKEIIDNQTFGALKKLFLESRALNLLYRFYKENEANQNTCEGCKFLNLPTEKEKIVKAKEILLYNLEQPPTIPELAKQVGINQCYLKKGFKEMFDSTVYDYIQHQRMQKARMLLISTTQPIGAIAEAVGFSSVSSFSQSFKKIVGVLPSELQKQ